MTGSLSALLLSLALLGTAFDGEFDWERDRVVRKNGKEQRGVVIESFDPEHLVLLRDGGRREEIRHADVAQVDKLRDRLASFMAIRRPELPLGTEWNLVGDAQGAGLRHMARLQAYHVLTKDPDHAGAHEFLGHRRSGSKWKWELDGKSVSAEQFEERSADWNDRLVLESEHFTIETNCQLRKALDVLFDLEALYLWWMENLGPILGASEDVDDPREEKITFLVHRSADESSFLKLDSRREPYYDPSGETTARDGSFNVARTYMTPDGYLPLRLFELGTESLIYSTLLLGKTKGRQPTATMRQHALWVEIGMGAWVARHCGGKPGYAEIQKPFQKDFQLDPTDARLTLQPLDRPHSLLLTKHEVTNLIGLSHEDFVGSSENIPLCRARCASFVAFCIEADHPILAKKKEVGRSRAGIWSYLRDVYGTPKAHSSSAFDDSLGGKIEQLEEPWKTWTQSFTSSAAGRKK